MAPVDPVRQRETPTLEVSGVSGAEGSGALRLTVSLGSAGPGLDTVAYATEDETATAGFDYEPAQGTLSFGRTVRPASGSSRVAIHDDAVDETDETFKVRLTDLRGGGPGNGHGDHCRRRPTRSRVLADRVDTGPEPHRDLYRGTHFRADAARSFIQAQVAPPAFSASPERLTFETANWAKAQSVTVTGICGCASPAHP